MNQTLWCGIQLQSNKITVEIHESNIDDIHLRDKDAAPMSDCAHLLASSRREIIESAARLKAATVRAVQRYIYLAWRIRLQIVNVLYSFIIRRNATETHIA